MSSYIQDQFSKSLNQLVVMCSVLPQNLRTSYVVQLLHIFSLVLSSGYVVIINQGASFSPENKDNISETMFSTDHAFMPKLSLDAL